MNRKTIISASDISIGYPKTRRSHKTCLHSNLSFDVYQGEFICLLGINGAGKSTLLRTISAIHPSLNGCITIDNKPITDYSEKELSQKIGLVLTDKTAIGGLTVRELVELGRYPYTGFFGQLSYSDRQVAVQAMKDVGISHKTDSYIAELSDGERQKAMIAKALAQECPIILLDEPTAFLDITSRIEITNLLHHLAITQQKTIVMSTHDVELALLLADRLWLLSRDKGLQCGVTEDIVFSGVLDTFFGSDTIVFNRQSGNFLPKQKGIKKIFVEAEAELFYWVQNLVNRQGFQLTQIKEEALFALEVTASNRISIDMLGTNTLPIVVSSFVQLVDYLREETIHTKG